MNNIQKPSFLLLKCWLMHACINMREKKKLNDDLMNMKFLETKKILLYEKKKTIEHKSGT